MRASNLFPLPYFKALLAWGILFLLINTPSWAQQLAPTQQNFGQNRVQKRKFDWQVISSNNFEVYFYANGQGLAKQLLAYAETEHERMNSLLGYSPFGRTKLFLYNSTAEMFQSNTNLELPGNINKLEAKLSNNKIEIAYPGENNYFREQFSEKLAQVFLYEMIYGGSLKDLVQSSVLMKLPEWFVDGCIAYTAQPWSASDADYMRDLIVRKAIQRPESLQGEAAKKTGKSVWNYIAETYGKENISNILNLTRIIRNNQTGISSTLATSYNKFLRDWKTYYTTISTTNGTNYSTLRADNKLSPKDSKQNLLLARQSNSGNYIVYSTEEKGQYRVFLYNTKTKLTKQLLKIGTKSNVKTNNATAPLFSWAQTDVLAIVYENGDEQRLQLYKDFGPKAPIGRLALNKSLKNTQQITSIQLNPDAKQMVFSAVKNNQNDLFLYDFSRGGITALTNDVFDDRNPQYIPNGQGSIMYLSNRTIADTTAKTQLNLKTVGKTFQIVWHSGTPKESVINVLADSLGNASNLTAINDSTALFLSDEKGVNNLYRFAKGDTTFVSINQITNSIQHIYDYQLTANGNFLFKTKENNKAVIALGRRLDLENSLELPSLKWQENKPRNSSNLFFRASPETNTPEEEIQENPSSIPNLKPNEIDTDNYKFDSNVIKKDPKETNKKNSVVIKSSARKDTKIKEAVAFKDKIAVVNIDNTFTADPLRGIGWLPTGTWSDLLQNQVVDAGLMITPNLKNYDLFSEYNNYTKLIDWGVRAERRAIGIDFGTDDPTLSYKFISNKVSAKISYPFSVVSRISLMPFWMDASAKEVDYVTFNQGKSTFSGYTLEYVYDNSAEVGLNQREGTRLKARYESVRGLADALDSYQKLTLDARNYTKLPLGVTLATRISMGRSFGLAPKKFKLGAVDNQIYNTNGTQNHRLYGATVLDKNDRNNYLFSDFTTNLRGFSLDYFNGQNHLLGNVELRLPINTYLKTQNSNLGILTNLQGNIFTDFGTVWDKRNPFAEINDVNTKAINNSKPFSGQVTDFKSPIIGSFGFGLRSTVLGYFIKADVAWGVEDLKVGNRMLHLSFGYDF
jgi:Tol biopolymer transport system component